MFIIILIISLFAYSSAHQEIKAYDCSIPFHFSELTSLLRPKPCEKDKRQLTLEKVNIQLLSLKEYEKVNHLSCKVKVRQTVTKCGCFLCGRNVLLSSIEYIIHVTSEQCKLIHDINFFQLPAFPSVQIHIKNNYGEVHATVVGKTSEGKCQGNDFTDAFGSSYEDVVAFMQVTVELDKGTSEVNLKDNTISIHNLVKCKFNDFYCESPIHGDTFWSVSLDNKQCDNNEKIYAFFTGEVTKITENAGNETYITYSLIEDDSEHQFIIESLGKSILCGKTVIKTQSNNIYLLETGSKLNYFTPDPNLSPKNLDISLFHSMKVSLTFNTIKETLKEQYLSYKYDNCVSRNKIISNAINSALANPRDFPYNFNHIEGIQGRIMGDALAYIGCSSVLVKIRKHSECTLEIPVYYGGREYFLTPRTKFLTQQSTVIPCNKENLPVHFINGSWYQRQSDIFTPISYINEISFQKPQGWLFKELPGLVDKGIYNAKQMYELKSFFNNPVSLSPTASQTIDNVHKYPYVTPFQQDPFNEYVNFLDKIKNVVFNFTDILTKIGIYFSLIFGLRSVWIVLKTIIGNIKNKIYKADSTESTFQTAEKVDTAV